MSWPPFLAPLREALEPLRLPEGAFHAPGAWEHRYSVCILGPERQAKGDHPRPYGALTLRRKPAGERLFTLDVEFSSATRGGSGLDTRASLTCAADPVGTPQKWELRAQAVEGGKPVPETEVAETGVLRAGAIVRGGNTERTRPAPRQFTSNWSLLEAVQRLPFERLPALEFDIFEDLDLHKPGQRLVYIGPVALELAGKPARLHGFRQIGRGILPTHYWLDDQHRLIAAAGSLRGFIWS